MTGSASAVMARPYALRLTPWPRRRCTEELGQIFQEACTGLVSQCAAVETTDGSRVNSTKGVAFDRTVPLLIVKVGHYPLHHGGVGAIRTLGRAGVPVYAVTEDRFTPAAVSRHLHRRFVAPTTGFEDEERLLEIYSAIGRQLGRPTVTLPTDDEAAVFIAEHAADLAPWFISPAVPADLPRRLSSKRGLHEICTELGVPTPRAVFPTSRHEVAAFAAVADFPVVAKNVDPWSRLRAPGRRDQHRRALSRAARRPRVAMARSAGGDAPGVHPPRGRRGLDLPRVLQRAAPTASSRSPA